MDPGGMEPGDMLGLESGHLTIRLPGFKWSEFFLTPLTLPALTRLQELALFCGRKTPRGALASLLVPRTSLG